MDTVLWNRLVTQTFRYANQLHPMPADQSGGHPHFAETYPMIFPFVVLASVPSTSANVLADTVAPAWITPAIRARAGSAAAN